MKLLTISINCNLLGTQAHTRTYTVLWIAEAKTLHCKQTLPARNVPVPFVLFMKWPTEIFNPRKFYNTRRHMRQYVPSQNVPWCKVTERGWIHEENMYILFMVICSCNVMSLGDFETGTLGKVNWTFYDGMRCPITLSYGTLRDLQ